MRSSLMMIHICKLMQNPNSRNYDSTSLNVKPSCFGSHAGCPSLTSHLRESDEKGIISSCSAGLLHCADCSSHLKESKWFERIWWKRHHVKLLCWPPPLRWLLQPSDGQRKASDLRESDGRGIMSSCSAGLLHCADCSSHLKESKWFERIWWKRHHVKLLCWPPPLRWLLLQPSEGKQVIWENLMEEASCQVALLASSIALIAPAIWWTKESKWFERIWWKRHHVKLLCWPPPLRWLLQPSEGKQVIWENLMEEASCQVALLASSIALIAPAIWRKASDLRESDGRGIMSSCSAGLLHCADCSSHLMDKGKQVIWENLMEEASCQVALLASSIALIAPAIWRKASDLRESDGRGIMSSCSAGLVQCTDCSSHLRDKDYDIWNTQARWILLLDLSKSMWKGTTFCSWRI